MQRLTPKEGLTPNTPVIIFEQPDNFEDIEESSKFPNVMSVYAKV